MSRRIREPDLHCNNCNKNFDDDDAVRCNVTDDYSECRGLPAHHITYEPGCPRCGSTDIVDYNEDVHYNEEDWR